MNSNIRVIQSIQRAFDIINCFNESKQTLSINEISNELSLHINTTRGIINTLVYNGYLSHDPVENKYSLGLIFIPKAELVNLNSVDRVKDQVKPYLIKIANKYQVSARLQLISQYSIFTVDTENPEDARYLLLTRLNEQFPLNATASGKLYLYYSNKDKRENYLNNINQHKYTENTIVDKAGLEKELIFIEQNGYSIENEEISIGISSVAVPLFNDKNVFMGTISITAADAIVQKILTEVVDEMKEASSEIQVKFKARF